MKGKIILAIVLACVVGCFIYYGVEEFWKPRSEQDATATESSNLNHTGGEDDTQEEQSKKVISNEKKETTDIIPAYSGKPYCELGGNVPLFTEEEKKSTDAFEYYSDLDSLGRCGIVFANVCRELMPVEERGTIGNIRPSGWHTVKYNDLIDGNYLYNRCHLIAYSLTGENDNEKNLITGTRYLNVEGMLPFEERVLSYVQKTGNHVLYRATPIYTGDNLLADGIRMEGWSVEDAGEGICFHVYCYNVQPEIVIDYMTGDSKRADDREPSSENNNDDLVENGTVESTEGSGITPSDPVIIDLGDETAPDQIDRNLPIKEGKTEFILNKNTGKIHLPNCESVGDMKEKNKKVVTGTVEDLKKQGYVPCKRCLSGY